MNFLFDNNLPPALAEALRLLGKSVAHVRSISDLGGAAPDDVILDHAAKWNYVVVTTDRAMRKAPHFQALIRAKQLRVVFIKTGSARQLDAWGIAKLVIKAWDGIEQHASADGRPFLALVQPNRRVMRA